MTGSSSRTAAAISPTTSTGVDGATTFRPGIIIAQFSMLWECCAPNRRPPPFAVLITSGSVTWPPVMYRVLAIWFAMMSQQVAKKSENINSATGRSPVIAVPITAPVITSSEIGVSRTRLSPNSSSRPGVVLNTPPAAAMSSPIRYTVSSRRISCASAWLTASR
jgi:hypothetical protein